MASVSFLIYQSLPEVFDVFCLCAILPHGVLASRAVIHPPRDDFTVRRRQELQGDVVTQNSILNALAQVQRWERAMDFLEASGCDQVWRSCEMVIVCSWEPPSGNSIHVHHSSPCGPDDKYTILAQNHAQCYGKLM